MGRHDTSLPTITGRLNKRFPCRRTPRSASMVLVQLLGRVYRSGEKTKDMRAQEFVLEFPLRIVFPTQGHKLRELLIALSQLF